MRNLWIAIVLALTALTFYSALWFKSESIEDDVTLRVTDALAENEAKNIDIDVDGRHVTLSGVVHDEATEDAYLDTADKTYGALGPIDGLTYQRDTGYVSAVKTDAGITLRGTVPDEDARSALVAEAIAATDGDVVDKLEIAGPVADWQNEAQFGVSQLAGLTSGTLTAAAGAYSLSGSTASDPAMVKAAIADRDGWNAFVSAPTDTSALEATVAQLNTDISGRAAQVEGLEGQVATLNGEVEALKRDLSARAADIEGYEATIIERDDTIATLEANIANYQGTQSEQVAALEARLAESDATVAERDLTIEDQNGVIAGLNEDLTNANAEIAGLGDQMAEMNATATANVANNDAEISALTSRIAGLETDLEAARAGSDEQVLALRGQLEDRDSTIADLEGNLAAAKDVSDQQIDTLRAIVQERDDEIESLSANLTSANEGVTSNEASIAELTAALAAAQTSEAEQVDALTAQIGDRENTIDILEANVADRDARVAALQTEVSDRDATIATLQSDASDLNATIAELQAQPTATIGLAAQQCEAEATAALEESRINFVTASAVIQDESIALLERLTGIALACVDENGLAVEVGGHTDAQGSDENNQALSEARAQAVVDFMAARGVPSSGLNAVGYGESQPIASNDTAEGRAQNRRISFDWQAR